MRNARGIVLGLVLTGVAMGAEKPIPQNPAQQEKRLKALREWNRLTLGDPYEKVGKKDPRWDDQARRALSEAGLVFGRPWVEGDAYARVHRAARAAIDAGCDDPMVVYILERTASRADPAGLKETIARSQRWCRALAESRYPAFRRATGHMYASTYILQLKELDEESKRTLKRDVDAALALLAESIANDPHSEFWENAWIGIGMAAVEAYGKLGDKGTAAYERVDRALARFPELKRARLVVRGRFWNDYGWEARTTASADKVPPGGFEKLNDRLGVAEKALEEAWRLGRDDDRSFIDARIANCMMGIDQAIRGDRDTMELWFDRAMKADSDNYNACLLKFDWLQPKWHGDHGQMIEFGRACRDTRNWASGIPLLAAEGHHHYAAWLAPADRREYMKTPEVWDDIRQAYAEYLRRFPDNHLARTKFAVLAYLGGHFVVANAQFERVGDKLTRWTEDPTYSLKSIEEMRDFCAKYVAAHPNKKLVKKKVRP